MGWGLTPAGRRGDWERGEAVTHWWRRRRNWRYKNEWVEERSFVKHPDVRGGGRSGVCLCECVCLGARVHVAAVVV